MSDANEKARSWQRSDERIQENLRRVTEEINKTRNVFAHHKFPNLKPPEKFKGEWPKMPKYGMLGGTQGYKNIFRFALGGAVIYGFFTVGCLYFNVNYGTNISTRLVFGDHIPTREERLANLRAERDAFFSGMTGDESYEATRQVAPIEPPYYLLGSRPPEAPEGMN